MAANSVRLLSISSDKLFKLQKKLSTANEELIKTTTKEFQRFGKALQEEARKEAPVQEGKVAQSIRYMVRGQNTPDVTLELTAGSKDRPEVIIRTILFGSKPHEIRPKNPGGVLVFRAGVGGGRKGNAGELIFVKHVNHPGTKPNNFIERAFGNMGTAFDRMLDDIGKMTVDFITED